MKLQMIETARTGEKVLSIGAWYVKQGLERQGHVVDVQEYPIPGYDGELFSVHHVTSFKQVVNTPKVSPVRVIGGHALYSNHKPLIPFADYFCFGEWDNGFEKFSDITNESRTLETLPLLRPYLNHEGTNSKAWYIEIARGCPYKCAYCELGNSVPYRYRTLSEVQQAIDACDGKQSRKVNLFAPDEASHPYYDEILQYIMEKGFYPSGFGSMRVEKAQRVRGLRANMLIRCGVDGLTEARRFAVGKRITDKDILNYFRIMMEAGHTNFKMFMIFGYEGESLQDFDQFARIMNHIRNIPVKKNTSLRIKWTPFIPQPGTPLAGMTPHYDRNMVKKILSWHKIHRAPKRAPGLHIENDGLMSERNHAEQVRLMTATEEYFL